MIFYFPETMYKMNCTSDYKDNVYRYQYYARFPLNPFVVNVFTEKYCQNGTDNGTYYGYCHIPFV